MSEARAALGLDVVIGFGEELRHLHHPAPAPEPGASTLALHDGYPHTPFEPTAGATQSFLIAGNYALADQLRAGGRLGVSVANNVAAFDRSLHAVAAISNLEVEIERELLLEEDTELSLGLGIALPTAQGADLETGRSSALSTLQGLVQEAAAAARGFEDGALFETARLGIIPKLRVSHRARSMRLESYVKLENLLSTRSTSARRYLGELIMSGFYGYELLRIITLGVRVWSSIVLDDATAAALLCEPQVRVRAGALNATLGVLLPIVSRFAEPAVASGMRLAASAPF
ncbi:MAG: hypothetical protein ABW321_06560 [Polyangiales bacterium]